MPFYVYECLRGAQSRLEYTQTRDVRLGVKTGVFYPHVERCVGESRDNAEHCQHFEWEMCEKDLLGKLGFSTGSYAVVIDMKPTVRNNVSLYQLRQVWGFSYPEWTPILVRLETLFVDRETEDPAAFKMHFHDRECERTPVHEFLYLQGGWKSGSWAWGRCTACTIALCDYRQHGPDQLGRVNKQACATVGCHAHARAVDVPHA